MARMELSYRGQGLRYRRYACNDHLGRSKVADAKAVNQRVDEVANKERKRLANC